MKSFIYIVLFLIALEGFGQDTIFFKNNNFVCAKVLEIDNHTIKYKVFTNQDGPTYTKEKSELVKIKFQNGEVEEIQTVVKVEEKGENDLAHLYSVTKKGSKVFVECDIPNGITHAENYIQEWGYWITTRKAEEADFTLNFILIKSWPDYYGLAQFINPKTHKVFFQTKKVSTEFNMDFNSKRGVIDKILRKRVKPLYDDVK